MIQTILDKMFVRYRVRGFDIGVLNNNRQQPIDINRNEGESF